MIGAAATSSSEVFSASATRTELTEAGAGISGDDALQEQPNAWLS